MNQFLEGFTDELTKLAGIGTQLAKLPGRIKRNPRKAIYGVMGTMLAGGALAQAAAARQQTREGGSPRYLHATADKPSPIANYNFHRHFKHKMTRKQRKRLHNRSKKALS